ncbi:MAG: hypothetical protein EP330_21900 [Deltaproteobacteria bacterium]|nr:MAG: hypothetical protein EP330_21900 [Deltaproteobacteria bacterium]
MPTTDHVVVAPDGSLTLETSHGLIAEDLGWAWICEEFSGDALPTGLVRTSDRWWMGTTIGVLASEDGCEWALVDGPTGLVRAIHPDVGDPESLWLADGDSLWVRDGDGFALSAVTGVSVRDAAQLSTGATAVLGFDGDLPVLDVEGVRVELPDGSGNMEIAFVDDDDRVYVHLPTGSISTLYRVDGLDVEVLLEGTDLIADVAAWDGQVYAVQYLLGTAWSADDGASFGEPVGARLECLERGGGGLLGCPGSGDGTALAEATADDPDPAAWMWTSVLDFDQVQALECDASSTVAGVCDDLWVTVASEFGIAVDEPVPEEPDGCGCRHASPRMGLWLLPLLGLIRRR